MALAPALPLFVSLTPSILSYLLQHGLHNEYPRASGIDNTDED